MESTTLWVCINCIQHLANGECGDCHKDEHEGGEPCSLLSAQASPGMGRDAHFCIDHDYSHEEEGCECQPEEDCECGNYGYSTMACDGCGSYYHGDRFAVTDWLDNG